MQNCIFARFIIHVKFLDGINSRSFVIVEWHKVTYKNRKIALVIISCMIIMSSCANKFVEDRNRKHTFVQASKVLVETVNRIYKVKDVFLYENIFCS